MSKNKKQVKPISSIGQSEFQELRSVDNPCNVTKNDIENITGITGTWRDSEIACTWCDSAEFVYAFEDGQTFYCANCSEEFSRDDIEDYAEHLQANTADEPLDTAGVYLSEEIAEVKRASDADYQRGIDAANDLNRQTKTDSPIQNAISKELGINGNVSNTGNITGTQQTFQNWKSLKCFHSPQQVIAGKNWGVWAGKKEDCIDTARNYDVVMNLTFSSIKEAHSIPIPELKKWESYATPFIELQMDWPDYGTIGLPRAFWEELVTYLETNHSKLLIFCQGGHGRTGTAVACLMVTALGYTAKQAIRWIRKNYCSSAIESSSQETYIRKIARKRAKTAEPETMTLIAESN